MTRVRCAIVSVLSILVASHAAYAQTQIIIDDGMQIFTRPSTLFTTGPRLTSGPDGELLIRNTLASPTAYGDQVLRDVASKKFYAVIHVLKWSDPTVDESQKVTQTVQGQNWYIFRGGSGWTQADFTTAKRLYGSRGFYLLAVHLNRSPQVGAYRLNYRITVVKKQAANVANLLAAAKLLGADFDALRLSSLAAPEDLWAGRYVPVDDVPSDITIAPEIMPLAASVAGGAPTAKPIVATPGGKPIGGSGFTPLPEPPVPAPVAKPEDDAKARDAAKPIVVPKPDAAKPEAAKPRDGAKPADGGKPVDEKTEKEIAELRERLKTLEGQIAAEKSKPPAQAPTAQSLGDAQKIDNEGKYLWDVSIGVPVRRVSDFRRTETGLDVKTVSKDTAFVMANIYFRPVDVKTPALNAIPNALIGFGIEKTPIGRFFIGGAWGPVYANFFAGVAFKRVEADGKTTYPREFTFGLNLPILAITKRLAEQAK